MSEKVDRKFGRIESPTDLRDFNLQNFIPLTLEPSPEEKMWDYPASNTLDQKATTHCVGFAMANFGINLPTYTPYTNEDGHKFYYMCKVVDGNPGSEEGSTLRSATKVLRNVGAIEAYAFAYNIETVKWWLLNRGPIIIGTVWTEEMNYPNKDGIITIGGRSLGGHAFLLNGLRKDDYARIHNSWGDAWGKKGTAWISLENLEKLLENRGEAVTAVELEQYKQTQDSWLVRIIKNIIRQLVDFFSTED